ncbi:hypothetical protein HK100_001839 [Physocladia obscura]|uniref:START domain-containing protein n=1 Tax=Physocladia obscura TaxID=109957 RepID=A0AAD5SZB6_9FUNG|nr:hypothetical protein HK100_001839 [Physocladia obscura]
MVHPHTDAVEAGILYLKELENATDFILSTQGHRTTIFTKPAGPDKPTTMPICKGQARLARPDITLDQVLSSLRNAEVRKKWDKRFEGMELIESYSEDRSEGLIHSLQHGQWPVVSGRDFCLVIKVFQESSEKGYVVFVSVVDDKVPLVKGRVRGHIYCVGWVVEKAADHGWDLTYFSHLDPVGLPSTLTALIATETPACAGTFASWIEKNGPMPSV